MFLMHTLTFSFASSTVRLACGVCFFLPVRHLVFKSLFFFRKVCFSMILRPVLRKSRFGFLAVFLGSLLACVVCSRVSHVYFVCWQSALKRAAVSVMVPIPSFPGIFLLGSPRLRHFYASPNFAARPHQGPPRSRGRGCYCRRICIADQCFREGYAAAAWASYFV